VVLAVRFTVEVAGQESGEQLALVEHINGTRFGVTGCLKICCAPVDFGIPLHVLEPHIEGYVAHAVHLMGEVTLSDVINKVLEMELRVPIEFEAATTPTH
jgi:hypothetical protein